MTLVITLAITALLVLGTVGERSNILRLFAMAGLALQYAFPTGAFLTRGTEIARFTSQSASVWLALATVSMLALSVIAGTRVPLGGRSDGSPRPTPQTGLFAFAGLATLVGVVLLARQYSGASFADRLIARSGAGYLFLFGYLGTAATFTAAVAYSRGVIRLPPLMFVSLVTTAFFALAGHRGGALVPSVAVAFALASRSGIALASRARVAILLGVLALNSVNVWTNALRVLLSRGGDTNSAELVTRVQELRERDAIPLSNSHLELLASEIENRSDSHLLLGRWSTILPSALNFVPRAVFPNKGATTGTVLVDELYPAWGGTGALTTGLFFELVYNFGIPLAVVASLTIFLCGSYVAATLWRLRDDALAGGAGIYVCWLLGINAFFDDLGGVVNKAVLGAAAFAILLSARSSPRALAVVLKRLAAKSDRTSSSAAT